MDGEIELTRLQRTAEAAGRTCVVGALIQDARGRLFVHRRAYDRRLFPGCWDIVGGRVEPGETLLEALAREVDEETGWSLRAVDALFRAWDWETVGDGSRRRRREFDFFVTVDGDLERPRLEPDKQVEFRWLDADGLAVLDENRAAGENDLQLLVADALRYLRRAEPAS